MNTSYLSAKIFHSSFVGINCTEINTMYKITDIYIWFFLAETLFLLKITSQQFDFHSIAKEHILKEHVPVKCSELFHLVHPPTLQWFFKKHFFPLEPISQRDTIFVQFYNNNVLFPTVLMFYFPEGLIKKHDMSTTTATEYEYHYIDEKDLLLWLFVF